LGQLTQMEIPLNKVSINACDSTVPLVGEKYILVIKQIVAFEQIIDIILIVLKKSVNSFKNNLHIILPCKHIYLVLLCNNV